jgi:hypothetical protein
MINNKTEAIAYLKPYLEQIRKWVADAEMAYKDLDPSIRRVHSPRTRSSNISDYIKDFVYQTIIGQEEFSQKIKVRYHHGSLRLLIEDRFQLTFKKVDNNLKPGYIPTTRQVRFYNHDHFGQTEFDNMPEEVTNIYAGYQWEPLDNSRIYLICPDGNRILWNVELVEPQEQTINEATPKTT